MGDRENGAELAEILRGADTDKNGTINYTGKYLEQYLFHNRFINTIKCAEFLAATIEATTFLREEYIKTAFKMFDADSSGKIDSGELR